MNLKKVLDIESDGLNIMADEEFLYLRCKRTMLKYRLADMSLIAENRVFKKDGKARTFTISDQYICLLDFCDFYLLDKQNLEILELMHIGENLSSDLVAVKVDQQKAYISMRNGKIIVVDFETKSVDTIEIGNDSSWDHTVTENKVYVGTINGNLIEIDKASMEVKRTTNICKKNIYGVIYENGILYTISQDMTIKAVKADTMEIICSVSRAVKGMTRILGIYGDLLVIADGGISLWYKNTLQLQERIAIPTGQFNKGVTLKGNMIIGSDYQSVYIYCI